MEMKVKAKKWIAAVLGCTMLMGQTVWAQDAPAETMESADQKAQMDQIQEGPGPEASGQAEEKSADTVSEMADLGENAVDIEEDKVEVIDKTLGVGLSHSMNMASDIYMDYPRTQKITVSDSDNISDLKVESADASVCEVEMVKIDDNGDICYVLYGKQEGTANISFTYSGSDQESREEMVIQTVTVKALPEDAVQMDDYALIGALVNDYYSGPDKNHDGYISYEEMRNISSISCSVSMSGVSIQNLNGLEYAENLTWLSAMDQTELSDISALNDLENLTYVDFRNDIKLTNIEALFDKPELLTAELGGTSVSAEDRFKLSGIQNKEMAKGDKISVPRVSGVFGPDFSVTEMDGTENLLIEKSDRYYYCELTAKETGTSEVLVTYEDSSVSFTVEVEGISSEQEIGADYEDDMTVIDSYTSIEESVILTSNGELWKTYPEVSKVTDDVKDYVAGWVYYSGSSMLPEGDWTEYWTDNEDILWNGSGKVAENIQRFDSHYALTNDGVLKDLYNGTEDITQVRDWVTSVSTKINNDGTWENRVNTYILKEDGTLWTREEVAKEETAKEYVKVDDGVQEIMQGYYLKDNKMLDYEGTVRAEDVDSFTKAGSGSYYSVDGSLHVRDFRSNYWNVGNIGRVKEIYQSSVQVDDMSCYYYFFIQTESDELYRFNTDVYVYGAPTVEASSLERIAENVEQLSDSSMQLNWTAKLKDGTYYEENGKAIDRETTEIILSRRTVYSPDSVSSWKYELILTPSDEMVARKNGVDVLDSVRTIWENANGSVYALRTDGTVWNITGIPEQVLDLSQPAYTAGDINGDDAVDLLDLMQCLNHVSKKSLLEGSAYVSADVDGNGTVDLIDLMRILNYVSKKTSEL